MARRAPAKKQMDTQKKNGILVAVIVLTLLITIFVVFQLLQRSKKDDNKTAQTNTNNKQTTQQNKEPEKTQPELPKYTPGSIVLNSKAPLGVDFKRSYRDIYYRVPNSFKSLFPTGRYEDALEQIYSYKDGVEPDKMLLVELVDFFGVSKEDFEAAVQKEIAYCKANGLDIKNESYEVPNTEIIYTFDYKVIKEYYKRA